MSFQSWLLWVHSIVHSEKAMATHSSTLAWEIPWTEKPGRLQSMGLQRVGHDWVTSFSLFTFMHWKRKWQPTPVLLPGETQGWEPGGLPSMGSYRVEHDWCDLGAAAALYILSNIFTLASEHVFSITKAPLGCKNVFFFSPLNSRFSSFSGFPWTLCISYLISVSSWTWLSDIHFLYFCH